MIATIARGRDYQTTINAELRKYMQARDRAWRYPWTVVRVKNRNAYMSALEDASVKGNIKPLAEFLLAEMQERVPEQV